MVMSLLCMQGVQSEDFMRYCMEQVILATSPLCKTRGSVASLRQRGKGCKY